MSHSVCVCCVLVVNRPFSCSFCDSRMSGLMLLLFLYSANMFPHSAGVTSEARHSCPGKLRYDNDQFLLQSTAAKYAFGAEEHMRVHASLYASSCVLTYTLAIYEGVALCAGVVCH